MRKWQHAVCYSRCCESMLQATAALEYALLARTLRKALWSECPGPIHMFPLFCLALCRLIEVIVLAFLTPAGRKAAAKVLRDAAASMHRLLRR